MKVKNKYLLKGQIFEYVSICLLSSYPPGYSIAAQRRRLVQIKNYFLEKKNVKDLTHENAASK